MKSRHSFSIAAGPGLANAIRRSLLADVASLAPREVTIRRNTSGHTDEFLAHRIGLIPFRRTGEGNELSLRMKRTSAGAQPLLAGDLIGPGIEPVHPTIPIAVLGPDQEVDLTVHFDEQTASRHARYGPCVAVGMRRVEDERHIIAFELQDPLASGKAAMEQALHRLEEKVDRALHELAHQPDPPPKSRC